MNLRTCVSPDGRFVYGVHRPSFSAANLRRNDFHMHLGATDGGKPVMNEHNFPPGDIVTESADVVYEIPNAFPFRGTTFINSAWAERHAVAPLSIRLPQQEACSMTKTFKKILPPDPEGNKRLVDSFAALPRPVLLSIATCSTDPDDLIRLAAISCDFTLHAGDRPNGLRFTAYQGGLRPQIRDMDLFEAVANNPHLPDEYKEAMVLRPGIQGSNEIVGEYENETHVFEYLRSNSYIPWGHYAANMSHDTVRYSTADLTRQDMIGLRHLYYQRTYIRLAEMLGMQTPAARRLIGGAELESLRIEIVKRLNKEDRERPLPFTSTLWGWNYGFDFAPSGFRLHASHQQIHQQYALVPDQVAAFHDHATPAQTPISAYAAGDPIASFCSQYRSMTGKDFFTAYIAAIRGNERLDKETEHRSLIVFEDEHVLLFVPKAQVSQWELQIMTLAPVGNIIEADSGVRASIDNALFIAQKAYNMLGASLVTSIEYAKRFNRREGGQRLLYSLLPKLPYAMGAFSEAQLRWVCGHYPEDFAAACRATGTALS